MQTEPARESLTMEKIAEMVAPFGIKVVVDDSLPPGEFRLESSRSADVSAGPVAWAVPNGHGGVVFGNGWQFSPIRTEQATMPLAPFRPQASADYQSVVDEALVVRHLGVASGDARADLKRVLDWDVAAALDPAVSSDAQALIDKGRNEAAERFQRNLKDPNVVLINMLRGTIAPITFDQLAHILGNEATAKWIADRQQRKESNHAPNS